MSELFENLPAISEEVFQLVKSRFTQYLFMSVEERGIKRFTCTACGEEFYRGAKILLRSETGNDRALAAARHKDVCCCPKCGTRAEVVNIRLRKISNMSQVRWYVVFLPVSPEKVFVRCFNYRRKFEKRLSGEWVMNEWQRYILEPGHADMYEEYYMNGGWERKAVAADAFVWNHGFYTEKYNYQRIVCDVDGNVRYGTDEELFDGTFLKYNSYFHYEGPHLLNSPYMKYMCWYARHPQIEMLVKMGRYEIVDRMIFRNTDDKKIFDWSAKTIWDLCRLPRDIYNHFDRSVDSYEMIDALKTYQMIKGNGIKDLDFARELNRVFASSYGYYGGYSSGRQKINEYIRLCKKIKCHPKDVLRYLRKNQSNSGFEPIYEYWQDYISMAIDKEERAANGKNIKIYNFNPLPKGLKAAHDKYLSRKQKAEAAKRRADAAKYAKKRKEELKERASELEKEYPKVAGNLAKIKDTFEFEDGRYRVIVPCGIFDILMEGETLNHCVGTSQRYYDRIEHNESYIMFLRNAKKPDEPWYTLEVEPGGTVRQKRTFDDSQDDGLVAAAPFIKKWQEEVSSRLTKKQKEYAKKARKKYAEEQAELRANGTKVHYGKYAGKLLADILDNDLIINEMEAVTA